MKSANPIRHSLNYEGYSSLAQGIAIMYRVANLIGIWIQVAEREGTGMRRACVGNGPAVGQAPRDHGAEALKTRGSLCP